MTELLRNKNKLQRFNRILKKSYTQGGSDRGCEGCNPPPPPNYETQVKVR